MRNRVLAIAVCSILIFSHELRGQEARPLTEDLLPENTVLYVQVRNIRELYEDFQRTNFGRMMADEKVAPLAQDLYAQARDAYAQFAEDEVGLSWDDLESLPAGEICFAAIAPRRADMQFVLFLDVDPELESAQRVLQRGWELTEEQGGTVEEDALNDVVLTTLIPPNSRTRLTHFQKGNTVVVTSNRELSEEILQRWRGEEIDRVRPLSQNRKFITIMNRCRSTKDLPPELRFYFDPIDFAKSATRGDVGSQIVINLLPLLGLDGLLAIGGTAIMDEQEFESVGHLHVLMANPRAGILEMLAFKPGDYRPPLWVSHECFNYFSTSLDFRKFYYELSKIVDGISGEGTMKAQIEDNFVRELELSLIDEVLPVFGGRMTFVNWMSTPVTANAQSNGFGFDIADKDKAETLLQRIMERVNRDNAERGEEGPIFEEIYRGTKYWVVESERRRERFEQLRNRQEGPALDLREPIPSFAIIGEALVITDSEEFIRHAIETYAGDHRALQDDAQMMDVLNRLTRLLGTDMPCGVMYSDPRYQMKWVLELADSDGAREFLQNEGDDEPPLLTRFRQGLRDNPPPKFEDIEKYFAPSGGFMTSDDTGIHLLIFQLKGN